MATLEKIRGKAGFLVAVIGIALLAFLAGDLIQGGSTVMRDREMNAFTVNGEAVKAQDFEARVRQMEEQMRARGQQSIDEATMQQLRNQVYSNLVSEQLLREEAEKIGLSISSDETFDLVQGQFISPIILQQFSNPQTGAFDKVALLNFLKTINTKIAGQSTEEQAHLAQYRAMWAETERSVRVSRLYEKYHNLITSGVVSNKLEIERQVKETTNVADIAYVAQSAMDVPDSVVSVSSDDVKKYYDNHKQIFRTESGAVIDLIYTNVALSESDYANAKADVDAARQELLEGRPVASVIDEYSDVPYTDVYLPVSELQASSLSADALSFINTASVGEVSPVFTQGDNYSVVKLIDRKSAPESLHVRHIVLAPEGTAGMPSSDSLFAIVKANPTEFSAIATANSLDRNSSAKGGEIGWLTEAMATQYVSPEFCKAVYSATVGVPFEFTSNYGKHIILVDEARDNVDKVKIAYATRQATASTETQTAAYNALSSFLATNKKNAGIDTLAMNAGYQVLSGLRIAASQPYVAQGLMNSRQVVRWAMNNKVGEVSDIMEADGKYIVARVNEKFEEGYMPLSSVSEQLRPIVAAEKKVDALYDRLQGKNYPDLSTFAAEVNSLVDTLHMASFNTGRFEVVGSQPALNAVAASAPLNKVMLVKGVGNVFLVNVLSRTPDTVVPTAENVKRELDSARAGVIRMQVMQEILKKAAIKDTRYKFM